MKVIGFTGNYGTQDGAIQSYLMADSSILYTGRPFFLPDFAQRFVAVPSIVVRTGRLGKCIAPKFAHRYWDAFTAAMVGDWVEAASLADPLHEPVEVMIDGTVVSRCCLADMQHPLDELLAGVSTRCSIKMGDLLFTGDAGPQHTLVPGNRLTATVGGHQVLDVKVRL